MATGLGGARFAESAAHGLAGVVVVLLLIAAPGVVINVNRLRFERPPASLFDARSVTWSAIDGDHACATIRFGDRNVSGVFEFAPDGLPLPMTGERFIGKGELRPWGASTATGVSSPGSACP